MIKDEPYLIDGRYCSGCGSECEAVGDGGWEVNEDGSSNYRSWNYFWCPAHQGRVASLPSSSGKSSSQELSKGAARSLVHKLKLWLRHPIIAYQAWRRKDWPVIDLDDDL